MHTIRLIPFLLLLSGCSTAFLQPEAESRRPSVLGTEAPCVISVETSKERSTRSCTQLERIEMMFDGVTVNVSTLADLRRMGFGPPHSVMESIPSPEIRSRLTKTTDGGMELLDSAVQACVMHPDAAYRCQLVTFSDDYHRSRGVNNPLARLIGINKVDIVSGWSWEASFVLERTCAATCKESHEHEYIVRYKQLRHTEDPPTQKRKRLPILDSSGIDLSLQP